MRSVYEAQWNTIKLPVFLDYILKTNGGKRCGGNSILQLEGATASGDRRYASGSTCYTENNCVAFFLDFLP
jgi:hypothetical protein